MSAARALLVALACVPAGAPAAPACLADFDTFLARFEADRAFQRAQTIHPLAYSVRDAGADPAARTVVRQLARAQAATMDELDFPAAATRQAQGLLEARQCTHPSACVIAFDRTDSPTWSQRFSFAQRRGCWRLVGISLIAP